MLVDAAAGDGDGAVVASDEGGARGEDAAQGGPLPPRDARLAVGLRAGG